MLVLIQNKIKKSKKKDFIADMDLILVVADAVVVEHKVN
jgi:hypothetical protein